MKTFIMAVVVVLTSCSSVDLRRSKPLGFETLFTGVVVESEKIALKPNESKVGRVLVGFLSAGPIGAIATANTEENFSKPMAYQYTISFVSNENRTVTSHSLVDAGSCVEVISPDESSIEVLQIVPFDRCRNQDEGGGDLDLTH